MGSALRRGSNLFRYAVADDFGEPETAFNFCTFWFIEALHLNGRTDEARQRSEEHLQQNGPSSAAYYWLGLLCDAAGQGDQACAYYRKAIYLEPQHREALTHLAAHLEAQGDQTGALRLYRRAQNPEVGERD